MREIEGNTLWTALLCIEDPEEIKGQYFTDQTTGDMHFVPE